MGPVVGRSRAGNPRRVAAPVGEASGEPVSLEALAGGVRIEGPRGLVLPRLVKNVAPKYRPSAMREKVQGTVKMFAIVGTDGKVIKSEVAQPLHPELDAQALDTLALWEFEPGRLHGVAVRVAITVQMTFKLH